MTVMTPVKSDLRNHRAVNRITAVERLLDGFFEEAVLMMKLPKRHATPFREAGLHQLPIGYANHLG